MKFKYNYKGFFLIELMVAIGVFSLFILIINLYIKNLYDLKRESIRSIELFCKNENFYYSVRNNRRAQIDDKIAKKEFKIDIAGIPVNLMQMELQDSHFKTILMTNY